MLYSGLFWSVPAIVIVAAPVSAAERIAPGTEARNAKAAFVYLSQATKDAALKPLDAALVEQRKRADALSAKLTDTRNQLALARKDASASKSRVAELERMAAQAAVEAAEAQEKFTQELADKDADYARELAILRSAADDILATPEGLKYLEANNGGDLAAADAIEEKLIAARQKMRDLQAAADRRAFAVVALDNRNKGLRTTAAVITRFEEVTRLDPGNYKDWITLAKLYVEGGNTTASIEAAQRAASVSDGPLQQSEALLTVAASLNDQGQEAAALDLARKARDALPHADAEGGNPEVWLAIGKSQLLIGTILTAQFNPADAVMAQHEALEANRKALAFAPQRPDLRDALANSLVEASKPLRKLSRTDEGTKMLEEARTLMTALTTEFPDFLPYRRSLIRVYGEMGQMRSEMKQFDSAVQSFDLIIELIEPLVKADSGNVGMLDFLELAYSRKGAALIRGKREADAIPILMRAVELADQLIRIDPKSRRSQMAWRVALDRLGVAYYNQKLYQQALDAFLKLRALKPDPSAPDYTAEDARSWASSFHRVGATYFQLGDTAAAREQYLKGYAIAKQLLEAHPDAKDYKLLMADLLYGLAEAQTPGFSWKMSVDYYNELARAGISSATMVNAMPIARENAEKEAKGTP